MARNRKVTHWKSAASKNKGVAKTNKQHKTATQSTSASQSARNIASGEIRQTTAQRHVMDLLTSRNTDTDELESTVSAAANEEQNGGRQRDQCNVDVVSLAQGADGRQEDGGDGRNQDGDVRQVINQPGEFPSDILVDNIDVSRANGVQNLESSRGDNGIVTRNIGGKISMQF